MEIYIVYGSYDWEEFSQVFRTVEEAEAFAADLFGLDSYDQDAIDEAYEHGPWKAFAIDCHQIETEGILREPAK